MKPTQYYQLLDLLEDIKGVDKMIQLHPDEGSGFMQEQYKAKKEKLVSMLIDRLVSPPLMSARSIHTIKMVIDKFYGDEMKNLDKQSSNDDLSKLELALA
jgi:hypothetical protein